MSVDQIPIVDLLGVRLLAITEAKCVSFVMDELEAGRGGWVITPNLDILQKAFKDTSIRRMLAKAEVLVADGMPLIWASRMQGTPLPERVAGSNMISTLCAAAARAERSIFLLGGMPGVADAAAEVLRERCPGLEVRGTYCPPFGFEKDEAEMARLRAAVSASEADIVFVALGFPKGERLTDEIRSLLPNAWWVGVGISFSFLTGDVKRAPPWMQAAGLEWVHRLKQEPRRLARRYLVDDLPFAGRLFASAAVRRLRTLPGRLALW